MSTLHEIVSSQAGWWGNLCWWIGHKLWPLRCFSVFRTWGTHQWVHARNQKHVAAAKMLLASGWHGGYCCIDGKWYTIKLFPGRGLPGDAAPFRASDVTDDDLQAIQDEIGMGAGGWDCVWHAEIIAACWNRLAAKGA